jgi:hypothetical protein
MDNSMNSHSENGYLLLFRGTDWHKGMSPEEMQRVVTDWMAWFDGLMVEGKCSGGSPLENEGKVITGAGGRMVADGPFAEAKEAIGGYFMLTVSTEEEAVAIARDCPGLPYGLIVEVRPVASICGMRKEAAEQTSQTAAVVR